MDYQACFEFLTSRRKDEIVVTSMTASRMWYHLTYSFDRVFYLDASMGLVSMFGAGIALGLPDTPVWAFSGDGSVSMNLGMFTVENELKSKLKNVTHFILSNRVYGSTNDVRLPNMAENDYAAIARGAGLERAYSFDDLEEFKTSFDEVVGTGEYTVVSLELGPVGSEVTSGSVESPELKYMFGRSIEAATGVHIFDTGH